MKYKLYKASTISRLSDTPPTKKKKITQAKKKQNRTERFYKILC